jgi:hypothetical protein
MLRHGWCHAGDGRANSTLPRLDQNAGTPDTERASPPRSSRPKEVGSVVRLISLVLIPATEDMLVLFNVRIWEHYLNVNRTIKRRPGSIRSRLSDGRRSSE